MNKLGAILLAGASAFAIAYWAIWGRSESSPVGQMGSSTAETSSIVKIKEVDYVSILNSALSQKSRFIALTESQNANRDREIEATVLGIPASNAKVRVNYHVEFPIGYSLEPGSYSVAKQATELVITLHHPQLVAPPAVTLKSFEVIDGGVLIDEKTALLLLQQRIQPETKRQAAAILKRPDIVVRSEKSFRGFLEPLLATAAKGGTPPPKIRFAYR